MTTVLIADDETSIRRLVKAALARTGWRVVEARDGDEALELLGRDPPDVALLDVQMPGCTGLELTRVIKSRPLPGRTRVILLTAKAQPSDVRAGGEAGADRYLTKPFSPIDLVALVKQELAVLE